MADLSFFLDSTISGPDAGQKKIEVRGRGDEFQLDDQVVIYNPANDESELLVVGTSSANEIIFTTNLDNNYKFSENARVIYVNKYNDITIALTGNRITKKVDDGTVTTIINEIAASGLEFEFFDQAGNITAVLEDIRSVGITLNMLDPKNPDAVIEFKTDVSIRNATAHTSAACRPVARKKSLQSYHQTF